MDAGKLTWEGFMMGMAGVLHKCKGWTLVQACSGPGGSYLKSTLTSVYRIKEEKKEVLIPVEHDCHIVYSLADGTPVLCFNTYYFDGKRLSYEHMMEFNTTLPHTVITQKDHPILNTPYFFLHPCNTSEVMKSLKLQCGVNPCTKYMLAWMSLVSTRVGFHLMQADYHKYFLDLD